MGDIPEARDTDHEDVSLALDVARSRLANGDHAEAIKWLRKAADTAFDTGDDRRGIELSKAAAELKPAAAPAQPQPPKPKPSVPPGPALPKSTPSTAPPGARPSPGKPISPPGGLPKPIAKPVVPTASSMGNKPNVSRATPATPAARARPSQAPPKKPAKPELPKQVIEEEDSTREFLVEDAPPLKPPPGVTVAEQPAAAVTGDEWPTESVSHISQAGDFTDRMHRDELLQAEAAAAQEQLPVSQAVRVAVSRTAEGYVLVRPLDANGLQEGEHDAMLVGLVADDDMLSLFR